MSSGTKTYTLHFPPSSLQEKKGIETYRPGFSFIPIEREEEREEGGEHRSGLGKKKGGT